MKDNCMLLVNRYENPLLEIFGDSEIKFKNYYLEK